MTPDGILRRTRSQSWRQRETFRVSCRCEESLSRKILFSPNLLPTDKKVYHGNLFRPKLGPRTGIVHTKSFISHFFMNSCSLYRHELFIGVSKTFTPSKCSPSLFSFSTPRRPYTGTPSSTILPYHAPILDSLKIRTKWENPGTGSIEYPREHYRRNDQIGSSHPLLYYEMTKDSIKYFHSFLF